MSEIKKVCEDFITKNNNPHVIRIDKKYVDSITTLFKCEEVDIKDDTLDFNTTTEEYDSYAFAPKYSRDTDFENGVPEDDVNIEKYDHDSINITEIKEEKWPTELNEHKQKNNCFSKLAKDRFCMDCDLSFPTQKLYRLHFLTNHTKDCHTCKKCNTIFHYKNSFMKHKCYECNICGKIMSHKYGFHRHMLTHGNERTVEELRKESNLDPILPTYECNFCSKLYRDKKPLEHHLQTVHYGLSYSCQKCGKQYKKQRPCINCQPELLNVKCPVCEREITRSHWQKHLRYSHKASTLNNKYACLCCLKDFSSNEKWIKHLRSESHFEASKNASFHKRYLKKIACPICNKVMKKSHLNGHMSNTHKMKQCNDQFDCLLCHEIFADVHRTIEHIQCTSHLDKINETKLKCNLCGNIYLHVKTLNTHMATVHRN